MLLIIPFTDRYGFTHLFSSGKEESVRLKCAIGLGDYDKLSKGYITGYNYELLEKFAESDRDSADTYIALDPDSCLDSLLLDSLDILVLPFDGKPLPEEFSASIPIDSLTIWVFKKNQNLQRTANRWLSAFLNSKESETTRSRFFNGFNPYRKTAKKKGMISPYDDLVRKYSAGSGLDWRMVAAIMWSESKFRIQTVSNRGAIGLMQLIPRTADRFGVDNYLDPEQGIKAGCGFISHIQNTFRGYSANEEELTKFTLAAYNAGEGRILDCIAFAASKGIDTSHWNNVKSVFPQMQSDAINLIEEVRFGKFSGRETSAFVDAVMVMYKRFLGISPSKGDPVVTVQCGNDTFGDPLESLDAVKDSLLSTDSLSRINP